MKVWLDYIYSEILYKYFYDLTMIYNVIILYKYFYDLTRIYNVDITLEVQK
jgi:hypothetical protein